MFSPIFLAGVHTAVHASLSTGDCYKFHGGIHTLDGYTFFQLQHVHGEVTFDHKTELLVIFLFVNGFQNNVAIPRKLFVSYLENQYFC